MKTNVSKNGFSQIIGSSLDMGQHLTNFGKPVNHIEFNTASTDIESGHSSHVHVFVTENDHVFDLSMRIIDKPEIIIKKFVKSKF